ncbi:Sir2-family regulator protein, partial [Globisporangium polare]
MQAQVLKQTASAVAQTIETAAASVLAADVAKLKRFLEAGRGNTAVLTGAG